MTFIYVKNEQNVNIFFNSLMREPVMYSKENETMWAVENNFVIRFLDLMHNWAMPIGQIPFCRQRSFDFYWTKIYMLTYNFIESRPLVNST